MKIVILGGTSDIGIELAVRFKADGHEVLSWARNDPWYAWDYDGWDVIIVTIGSMVPIARYFETNTAEWEQAFMNNLFYPLRLLKDIYELRKPNSTVIFFAGPNPNATMANYSAYTTSKTALIKMVECLELEEDAKFIILGPGTVKTKIQNQTIGAGKSAGENHKRVKEFMKSGKGTSHDELYAFVKHCISLPKEVVGGRNISIRDDWNSWKGTDWLKNCYNMYRLRRSE